MAKVKEKETFYWNGYNNGGLRPGSSIAVERSISYRGEKADFTPFLKTPPKELKKRLKESTVEEKKIYDALQKEINAWEKHGAQTLLLQKAIEYLETPQVKHTGNEWKRQKDGSWEISNMVYKMTFSIVDLGDEWKLAWEIQYTAPGQRREPYYSYYDNGPKKRIEYEGSKKYKTMAGAQNYIQSKFDQYARYFESLSPPVPEAAKPLFCVNGQLLQGYSVGQMEATEQALSLSELLACLDDGDVPAAKGKREEPQKQEATPPGDKPKAVDLSPQANSLPELGPKGETTAQKQEKGPSLKRKEVPHKKKPTMAR